MVRRKAANNMRLLTWMLLATVMTDLAGAAQAPTLKADHRPEVETQVLQVEKAWNEAVKLRDRVKLARFCAEDFVTTDEEGSVSTKAQFVDAVMQHFKLNSYALTDMKATVYGDTAIVVGQWKGSYAVDGDEREGVFRFTDTFIKRDGQWWAAASHMSKASP